MIVPAVAPVRPRIISPGTGETFLLEDFVASIAQSTGHGTVRLYGPSGSGKTTALRHLAATVHPDLKVVVLDDAELMDIFDLSKRHLVVYSCGRKILQGVERKLASWNDDDFIEYLLARHHGQVSSVFQRIRGARDRQFIGGSPELWRVIIDEMADDESIVTCGKAVARTVTKARPRAMAPSDIERFCKQVIRQRGTQKQIDRLIYEFKAQHYQGQHYQGQAETPELIRLLRHRGVQSLLHADDLERRLKSTAVVFFKGSLPAALIQETAARIRSSGNAIARLRRLFEDDANAAATAASILHACRIGWRPDQENARLNLSGAHLCGADWNGIRFNGADLGGADFAAADFSEAHWRDVRAHTANFEDADFSNSDLGNVSLFEANLHGAKFSGARGNSAGFFRADLRSSDFTKSQFLRSSFCEADLRNASFQGADLNRAKMSGANIEGTDFRQALLHHADLRGLPLKQALLDGACFDRARLDGCDLEYVRLRRASFERARLCGAYLTASIMRGVNFRGADLTATGLGEIDWEGADLSGAVLYGCSFHLGSTRSGLVGSPYPSEGTRTGFYTDDYDDQYFKAPEEIRKANLRGADLRGAIIDGVDFYLVDLRDAKYDRRQEQQFRLTGAILFSRMD